MAKKNLTTDSDEKLLLTYREAAFVHGQATLNGDYKIANNASDTINKIYGELKIRKIVEKTLTELLGDESVGVKVWAATHLLPFNEEKAEKILEEISLNEKGILGFDAEMVLIQWRKGELYFRSVD